MPRRLSLSVVLCLLGVVQLMSPAGAVEIDKSLQDEFAGKDQEQFVRVLMVYDRPNILDPGDVSPQQKADPKKRRAAALAALKKKALLAQTNAASVLTDPALQSGVRNVYYLYLANAIVFEANRKAVDILADLPDAAILFHDQAYDLTADTRPGLNRASPTKNTAATDTVWSVKYINADQVWRELGYDGSGVVVAHIDTGVWLAHPDLAGRLWTNPGEIPDNGIDDDNNGYIDDVIGWDFGVGDNNPNDDSPGGGHGTHTAGNVCGDGTGGTLTGTAPGARLMVLKVWRADGSGGTLGTIWLAQQYAAENGARIITMSLGFSGGVAESFRRSDRYNANNLRDAGVVFFNSAGNDHFAQTPPVELTLTARIPAPWNGLAVPHSSTSGIISVGGTGYRSDVLYSNSSRGPAKWDDVEPWNDWPYDPGPGLIKPDVSAPGVNVNSTVIGGGYSGDTWSGTSMSCPHAAGVAALMLQKNPSLSPAGVDSLMELNAIDLGVVGKDNMFGAGRLDAFLIVSAVPADQQPDLTWTSVLPDPAGDSIIDPGRSNDMAFELRNASQVVAAVGVTASLAVVANPWVTVADPDGSFGDIPIGGQADNTGGVFSLAVAADAPQGYEFTMLLTVRAASGYEQTFDIAWSVGLPDWRTHDLGGIYLTITDQGSIGYLSQDQVEGAGLGLQDNGSNLFIGSFWAGTDVDYICNRDYDGLGSETHEWVVSDIDPNGRVRDLGALDSDQTFAAVFTDGGHASPKPLLVEQTTMAFGLPENDQFVILQYELTNNGPEPLPELFNGVFCDFDIGDSGANLGGTDSSRNLSYLYEDGGTYVGMALLGEADSAQNVTVINNPFYVYPTSAIEDGNKMRMLRGLISDPVGPTPDDWSALTSSVVSLDADGGQAIVAYALVIGEGLAAIQAAVDAANAAYDTTTPIDPDKPVKVFRLAQNAPNPFNPETEIKYIVPVEGQVDLAVYNLHGARVRTLVNEIMPAGEQSVLWDGRNEAGNRVPSGMYFYKYVSGGQSVAKKMTLIK